ncbi:hypothetical protein D3C72_1705290 [compost metagenome]
MALAGVRNKSGNKPSDSRSSIHAVLASGTKVITSLLRRMVVRGAPVSVSMRSICCTPSQTCQMREADITEPADTTKVPV